MTWRCLWGGDEKCTHNSSKWSNSMQPGISSMVWTFPSFTLISAEGMGDNSYPNVRSPNRHMPGECTFQIGVVSRLMPRSACSFINAFRSPTVSLFPMSTGKALLDLWRTQQKSLSLSSEPMIEWFVGLTTSDWLPLWDRSDRLESIDQVVAADYFWLHNSRQSWNFSCLGQ